MSCVWVLTDENGHGLTASSNTRPGHCRDLHLVKHGHQARQHGGQHVPIHRLVDVVTRLVVGTAPHAPNLAEKWEQECEVRFLGGAAFSPYTRFQSRALMK